MVGKGLHITALRNENLNHSHKEFLDYQSTGTIILNKIKKNISKKSLFLFSNENEFRLNILNMVNSSWFLKVINIINIISSISLIFETNETFPDITNIFSKVTICLYLLEFLLKIIAYGFVLDENTYLRDPWNFLDMSICFSGLISLLPQISDNLFIVGSLRIIRPMKVVFIIPNMKSFIYTLIFSMFDISAVFMILLFFFILFALLGLSLWSDIHDYRCRLQVVPVNGSLFIDKNFPTLCGGMNNCNNNMDLCLSSKEMYNKDNYFMIDKWKKTNQINFQNFKLIDKNKDSNFLEFDHELYYPYLNYGITNFRNFLYSLYIVFQSTTTEGWTEIMYQVMEGNSYYMAVIYFFFLIIINNFFLLNLTVAVLLYNFEKNSYLNQHEGYNEKFILEQTKNIFKNNSYIKSNVESNAIHKRNSGLEKNIDKDSYNNYRINITKKNSEKDDIISKMDIWNKKNNLNAPLKKSNKEEEIKKINSLNFMNNVMSSGVFNNNTESNFLNNKNFLNNNNKLQILNTRKDLNEITKNFYNADITQVKKLNYFNLKNDMDLSNKNIDKKINKINDNNVDKIISEKSLIGNSQLVKDKSKGHADKFDKNILSKKLKKNIFLKNNELGEKLENSKKAIGKRQSLHSNAKVDNIQEKIRNEQIYMKKYKKKYKKIKKLESKSMNRNQIKNLRHFINYVKKFKFFTSIKRSNNYHLQYSFSFYCYFILNQPLVQYIFYTCILINSLILTLDRSDQTKEEKRIMENLNIFLVSIFAFENLLMFIALGAKKFVSDFMNLWDSAVVIFSILELSIINPLSEVEGNKRKSIASVFRILRILRLFKLVRSWKDFKMMMQCIFETMKRMINYFLLLCLFIYIYALIGCNLFKNSLRFNSDTNLYDSNAPSNYDNFDNFQNSVLSVFYLFIGDGWYTTFFDCFRSEMNSKVAATIYFISIILFMQISLVNIFLAYLIDNFKLARKYLQRNAKVKNYLLNLNESTLIKHENEFLKQRKNSKFTSTILALIEIYANQKDEKAYFIESKITLNATITIDFVNLKASEEVYLNKMKRMKIKIDSNSRSIDLESLFPVNNRATSFNYFQEWELDYEQTILLNDNCDNDKYKYRHDVLNLEECVLSNFIEFDYNRYSTNLEKIDEEVDFLSRNGFKKYKSFNKYTSEHNQITKNNYKFPSKNEIIIYNNNDMKAYQKDPYKYEFKNFKDKENIKKFNKDIEHSKNILNFKQDNKFNSQLEHLINKRDPENINNRTYYNKINQSSGFSSSDIQKILSKQSTNNFDFKLKKKIRYSSSNNINNATNKKNSFDPKRENDLFNIININNDHSSLLDLDSLNANDFDPVGLINNNKNHQFSKLSSLNLHNNYIIKSPSKLNENRKFSVKSNDQSINGTWLNNDEKSSFQDFFNEKIINKFNITNKSEFFSKKNYLKNSNNYCDSPTAFNIEKSHFWNENQQILTESSFRFLAENSFNDNNNPNSKFSIGNKKIQIDNLNDNGKFDKNQSILIEKNFEDLDPNTKSEKIFDFDFNSKLENDNKNNIYEKDNNEISNRIDIFKKLEEISILKTQKNRRKLSTKIKINKMKTFDKETDVFKENCKDLYPKRNDESKSDLKILTEIVINTNILDKANKSVDSNVVLRKEEEKKNIEMNEEVDLSKSDIKFKNEKNINEEIPLVSNFKSDNDILQIKYFEKFSFKESKYQTNTNPRRTGNIDEKNFYSFKVQNSNQLMDNLKYRNSECKSPKILINDTKENDITSSNKSIKKTSFENYFGKIEIDDKHNNFLNLDILNERNEEDKFQMDCFKTVKTDYNLDPKQNTIDSSKNNLHNIDYSFWRYENKENITNNSFNPQNSAFNKYMENYFIDLNDSNLYTNSNKSFIENGDTAYRMEDPHIKYTKKINGLNEEYRINSSDNKIIIIKKQPLIENDNCNDNQLSEIELKSRVIYPNIKSNLTNEKDFNYYDKINIDDSKDYFSKNYKKENYNILEEYKNQEFENHISNFCEKQNTSYRDDDLSSARDSISTYNKKTHLKDKSAKVKNLNLNFNNSKDCESENTFRIESSIKIKAKNRKSILNPIRNYIMTLDLMIYKNYQNLKIFTQFLNERAKENISNNTRIFSLEFQRKNSTNNEIVKESDLEKSYIKYVKKLSNINEDSHINANLHENYFKKLYRLINSEFENCDKKLRKKVLINIKNMNENLIQKSVDELFQSDILQENLKREIDNNIYKSEFLKLKNKSCKANSESYKNCYTYNNNKTNYINPENENKNIDLYYMYNSNFNFTNHSNIKQSKSSINFLDKNRINSIQVFNNERRILRYCFFDTLKFVKKNHDKTIFNTEKKEENQKDIFTHKVLPIRNIESKNVFPKINKDGNENDKNYNIQKNFNIEQEQDLKKELKFKINKSKNFMEKIKLNLMRRHSNIRLEDLKKNFCKFYLYKIKSYISQSSLGILHRDFYIRKLILQIVLSKNFDFFIMMIIVFNTILLILDNPWNNPDGPLAKIIVTTNYIFTIIFALEAVLKILGFGLIFYYKNEKRNNKLLMYFEAKEHSYNFTQNSHHVNHSTNKYINLNNSSTYIMNKHKNPNLGLNSHNNDINNQNLNNSYNKLVQKSIDINAELHKQDINISNKNRCILAIDKQIALLNKDSAYLRSVSNCIDFFVVIIGIIDIIDTSTEFQPAKYFKALRLIRSLRPIRIFTKSQNLKIIIACLVKSIPAIGNTFIICGVFIYIYIIIGIGLFKSEITYVCSQDDFWTEESCINAGGIWNYNINNFDNFFNALQTLFSLMMIQGWVDVTNLAYKKTQYLFTYFYFISFIIFGHLFVLNLIISVVIEKYKTLKNKNSRLFTLSDEEKEWIKVQKIMLKFRPIPKIDMENSSESRKNFYKYISSKNFENGLSILILVSMILLMMQYNGASEQYMFILDMLNLGLNILFNIELIVKLYVFRSIYFYSNWNKIDFFIIIICDILVIVNVLQYLGFIPIINQLSNFAYIFRAFRILKVVRLMTVYSKLRGIIDTLIYLVPSIINIGTIMLIILVIYGCIGVNLFSTLPFREEIHQLNNFRDFVSAFVLLFKILTGESWNYIMYEASYHECTGNYTNSTSNSDYFCGSYPNVTCNIYENINYTDLISGNGYSCGSDMAYPYFISFMIVGPIFIMNLCIVMVVEGFAESMYENESLLSQEEMDNFISVWINYDTNFKKKVHPHELVLILKQLQPPLGFNYDRFYIIDPIKLNYSLRKVRKNKRMLNLYEKIFKNGKLNIGFLKDGFYQEDKLAKIENINNEAKLSNLNSKLYKTLINIHFKNNFDEKFATMNEEKLNPQINTLMNFIKNGTLKRLKNSYEIQNFFFSLNKKFWTTNIEILQIMNIFKFAYHEEKKKDKPQNEIVSQIIDSKKSFIDKELYIHFVDACLALSRLVVSKKNTISLDLLRENVVGKFTQKLWKNKFKDEKIDNYFAKNQQLISEKLSFRIISKVKGKLIEKLRLARERIAARNHKKQEELIKISKNKIANSRSISVDNKLSYDFNNTFLKGNELNNYLDIKNSNKFFKTNLNDNEDRKEKLSQKNLLFTRNNFSSCYKGDTRNQFNKGSYENNLVNRKSNKSVSDHANINKEKSIIYHKIYNKQQTNIEFYKSEDIRVDDGCI